MGNADYDSQDIEQKKNKIEIKPKNGLTVWNFSTISIRSNR